MPKAKPKKAAPKSKPLDFEAFVRGALASGKPPKAKQRKRKAKK